MATHSSALAWAMPWTEEPGGLQSLGLEELDTTEWLSTKGALGFLDGQQGALCHPWLGSILRHRLLWGFVGTVRSDIFSFQKPQTSGGV